MLPRNTESRWYIQLKQASNAYINRSHIERRQKTYMQSCTATQNGRYISRLPGSCYIRVFGQLRDGPAASPPSPCGSRLFFNGGILSSIGLSVKVGSACSVTLTSAPSSPSLSLIHLLGGARAATSLSSSCPLGPMDARSMGFSLSSAGGVNGGGTYSSTIRCLLLLFFCAP